ncbi:hypothetical protein [Pedobacter sp. CFBP9032]|uniref:hypothetical protein n=1 Tax=Pedobacter sp. CFBP9032 TaxID=3096539 RepID=UPI002A6B3EE2|nr:hypothetical protein [Pedobacter sp. CFBP9032]MDY0905530.1 hypothetical protein [Pedobacter sp. CFBP9032]
MDKTKHPLVVLKEMKSLIKRLENKAITNNSLIEIYTFSIATVAYQAVSETSFYFDVLEPTYKSDYITFRVMIKPTNEIDHNASTFHLNSTDLIEKFEQWIELMKDYDSFSFSDDEVITKQYEEEFYADFEILDDDADEKAFEPEKQILLYKWLTALEQDLKSSEMIDQATPLIEETAQLREDIQNLTKKQFIRRFAILMSKVKKSGLKLLFEVLDIAKKEAMKKALYGGLKGLGDLSEHVINAIT